MTTKKSKRYQDYVIKDGILVGDFEGLYRDFDDPWHQSIDDSFSDSRRLLMIHWANKLRNKYSSKIVVEIGCGFGHITNLLTESNFQTLGIDVSETAVKKAKLLYPKSDYILAGINDFDIYTEKEPDIFVMPEVTWYILDDLDNFLTNLKKYARKRSKPTFLIHLLATYASGVQKYGAKKFTTLDEIVSYFDLDYLEYAHFCTPSCNDPGSQGTFFVAKV
jgi:SAM-dependent methyltransferase